MKRALLIVLAVATGGCSIVLKPDRDAIVRAMDAGMDADSDGSSPEDAGDGAGPDACSPEQDFEVSCNDLVDNDCDGLVDCDELECGASGFCCSVTGGGVWEGLRNFVIWDRHPTVTDAVVTMSRVEFGTGQFALSLPACAPLAFGMHFDLMFQIEPAGAAGEFASFVLAPVDEPRGGSFLADFRLRVDADGTARAERAGRLIGRTTTPLGTGSLAASVDLIPGIDEMGRAVLLVSASIDGQPLASNDPLMPLADLRGPSVGCAPDGLFVVVEGRGTHVEIVAPVGAATRQCDNPAEFLDDSMGELGGIADRFTAGVWRAGGLGEPTLFHVGSPENLAIERIDVFADSSTERRRDDDLGTIDFGIGGTSRAGGGWGPREPGGDPVLLGTVPSSREPSVFIPNDGGNMTGMVAFLAYARELETRPGRFEIALTSIELAPAASFGFTYSILEPDDMPGGADDVEGCESLRDPSLVALGSMPQRDGLLVFFTCDPTGAEPDWIGAAHLTFDVVASQYAVAAVFHELLTSNAGDYAAQGVSSPEVLITGSSARGLDLRVWFLAKGGDGNRQVAFAFGEVAPDGTPRLSAFGGNPILDASDPVLGGTCTGCAIESMGVMRTTDATGIWSQPSYVFLVERRVGDDHQLIPLRQPRPNGG